MAVPTKLPETPTFTRTLPKMVEFLILAVLSSTRSATLQGHLLRLMTLTAFLSFRSLQTLDSEPSVMASTAMCHIAQLDISDQVSHLQTSATACLVAPPKSRRFSHMMRHHLTDAPLIIPC